MTSTQTTTIRIRGTQAIAYAREHGLDLSKYADPTESARDGLSVDEATEVAREDDGLVYLDVPADVLADQVRAAGAEWVRQAGEEPGEWTNEAWSADLTAMHLDRGAMSDEDEARLREIHRDAYEAAR